MFAKRFLRVPCLVLAIVILLSACSGTKETSERFDGTELSIWTTFGPNDGGHGAYTSLYEEFAESSGALIRDGSVDSSEEWKQSVFAAFREGTEPDILFFFTGADAESFVGDGQVVSLDEIRESYPDYAANINLNVLQTMKAADGKSYAVPIKGYWERLFVNTDIFESLSLTPPDTLDALFALAAPLREAGYIPLAASLTEVPHYLFEAFLFEQTGPAAHLSIPDDPDKLPQAWIDGLALFRKAYEAGLFAEDAGTIAHSDAFALFQQKKAAMIIDGDWTVASIQDTESTEVVNFPANPGGARKSTDVISGFSMGFYISRKAWDDPDKRAAAVSFVSFLTSNASIAKLNVSGAAVPISASGTVGGEGTEGQTALRRSIDALNAQTTAFVGAVADNMNPDARNWLFSQILPIAKGEAEPEAILREFVIRNNG